jgi:putative transposase
VYHYRKLTQQQKFEAVEYRRLNSRPLHSPPHWRFAGQRQFIITAACYEHKHIIGTTHQRMTMFENDLLDVCGQFATSVYAWSILPNHYHVLVRTDSIDALRRELGSLHGRSSFSWNHEENQRGRKVWFNCFERDIRSHRHFWASVNYIHHNPVKHGYVDGWQDWLLSSAAEFLERVGRERAVQIWREFPILDYGRNGTSIELQTPSKHVQVRPSGCRSPNTQPKDVTLNARQRCSEFDLQVAARPTHNPKM